MMAVNSTATEVFIPKLGQTVEEVTFMDWLVEDGVKVDFGMPRMSSNSEHSLLLMMELYQRI